MLNRTCLDDYKNINLFFNGIVLDIDVEKRKMIFSSAGQTNQFLLYPGEIMHLEQSSAMLGLKKASRYKETVIELDEKYKVLLFTAGLFEGFNSDDEKFDERDLVRVLKTNSDNSINDIIEYVLQSLDSFLGNRTFQDDITIVGLEQI